MPEILEIEMYRRAGATTIGRLITGVRAPDDWFLKGIDASHLADTLVGASVEGVDRVGKLLLVETSAATVGMRFGMTGRLIVDDGAVIDRLEYSSVRLDPSWNRFGLDFADGSLTINDPRRLGGVALDPDPASLGPDAWQLTGDELVVLLSGRTAPVKATLLDQAKIAGLGNLLVDELLWRAGIAPSRQGGELPVADVLRIAGILPTMLDELYERGGSHRGDLHAERRPEGRCPRDGAELQHATVGGRSTWWCPEHQH